MSGVILSPEDHAPLLRMMRRQTPSPLHRRMNALPLLDDGWAAERVAHPSTGTAIAFGLPSFSRKDRGSYGPLYLHVMINPRECRGRLGLHKIVMVGSLTQRAPPQVGGNSCKTIVSPGLQSC